MLVSSTILKKTFVLKTFHKDSDNQKAFLPGICSQVRTEFTHTHADMLV